MNLIHNINNYIFRPVGAAGVFNFKPPYSFDASRWLQFTDSTEVIDAIGDETRPLQPDNCIKGNTTDTVTFPVAVTSINWYDELGVQTSAAISGAWIIPSADIVRIDEFDAGGTLIGILICESGNDLTIYDVSGNGNHATLYNAVVWDVTQRNNKNWLNRYGYNVVGDVYIPAQETGNIDAVGNALSNSGIAKMNGEVRNGKVANYDGSSYLKLPYRMPQDSGQDINISFDCYDINTSPANTEYFLGSYKSYSNPRFSIYNPTNLNRISVACRDTNGDTFIKNIENINSISHFRLKIDRALQNIKVWIDDILKLDTDFLLTGSFYNAGADLINVGSRNNGNNFLNGKIANLVFNEDTYYFNNLISSSTGIEATNNGVTFIDSEITTQATIDSLANKCYKDVNGNIIVNPKYAATTETILKGKGYKGVGNIDFNPDQLESYKSYEDNSVVDNNFDDDTKWTGTNWVIASGKATHSGTAEDILTSTTSNPATIGKEYRLIFEDTDTTVSYGGNDYTSGESKVATTTDDLAITSNIDGAEISLVIIQEVITHVEGSENLIESLVNGANYPLDVFTIIDNGYNFANNGTSYQGFKSAPMLNLSNGDILELTFDFEVISGTIGSMIMFLGTKEVGSLGSNHFAPVEGFNNVEITVTNSIKALYFVSQLNHNLNANITNIKLYKKIEPVQVGELSQGFFNQLAFKNNPFGLTPHFTQDIVPYINWNDVYSMTPDLFNLLCSHPEYVLEEYRGYWYNFKESVLTDSVFYKDNKTIVEQNKINNKGGCPIYTELTLVPYSTLYPNNTLKPS